MKKLVLMLAAVFAMASVSGAAEKEKVIKKEVVGTEIIKKNDKPTGIKVKVKKTKKVKKPKKVKKTEAVKK